MARKRVSHMGKAKHHKGKGRHRKGHGKKLSVKA